MRHLLLMFILFVCLVMLSCGASAADETAADLTAQCRFSTKINADHLAYMHNNKYINYWDGDSEGEIQVICPKGKPALGVMITMFKCAPQLRFEDEHGKLLAVYDQPYATDWVPFTQPASSFTIKRGRPEDELRISNIHILGEGKLPDWVQQWQTLSDDADLMLISTHPDDEILWFGGLLPTYAGERGKKVIVVYMTGGLNGMRTAELLDGLWDMGVRYYPDIGSLPDKSASSKKSAQESWGGKEAVAQRITAALRKYRPKVVVTQDIKGEYGHLHHVVTVEEVINSVTSFSGDPDFDPESAAAYGVHTPQKLYLHLWKEGRIKFNWRVPLNAFEGKTGLEIARRAYQKHVSQQNSPHHYKVNDKGRLDNSLFGLYFTSVGPDEAMNDLFEHIE